MTLRLYHVLPDNDAIGGARNGSKVAIALREIGVPFLLIPMNREKDLRPEDGDYRLNINPNGKVPTLDDDGTILWESGAILIYLATKFPEAELLPGDLASRAKAIQWIFWEGTVFEPYLVSVFGTSPAMRGDPDAFREAPCGYLFAKGNGEDSEAYQDALKQFYRQIKILDKALEEKSYIAGAFSIADIALGPHVAVALRVGVDFSGYKNIVRWLSTLADRPAWLEDEIFPKDLSFGRNKGLI